MVSGKRLGQPESQSQPAATQTSASGVKLNGSTIPNSESDESQQTLETQERSPSPERTQLECISVKDESRLLVNPSATEKAVKVVAWKMAPAQKRLFRSNISMDSYFLTWPGWAFYAALTKHGDVLGLTCSECVIDAVSSYHHSLYIPPALKPTPLQQVTPHQRWIDRFPFPRFRDNMILLSEWIILDDFVHDLFLSAAFTLKPAGISWEPESWVVGREFASKWGYLFK
jgi:hypothetical protein